MGSDTKPLGLASTFAVLRSDQGVVPVPVTPTVYEELDRQFDGFAGHWLVSAHSFDADWPTWEIHPAGEDIVYLLSGAAEMVPDRNGTEENIGVSEAGTCVIVPRGTWHTARISTPTAMLFITPGEGTEKK